MGQLLAPTEFCCWMCNLTLESMSLRLRSRCFRTLTAFLMRWYRSSGRDGAKPSDFKIRRILLPVTNRT